MVISNDDLVNTFKVGNAGGMRYSGAQDCLVLIADHTKALYDDRWEGDVLHYTGMGTTGDQTLTGQNLRLANQTESRIAVHLFEVFQKNQYTYAGQVGVAGSVKTEHQPDEDGKLRTVFVFSLKLQNIHQPPTPTIEQIEQIRRDRQRKLRAKSAAELMQLASWRQTESRSPNRLHRSVRARRIRRRLCEEAGQRNLRPLPKACAVLVCGRTLSGMSSCRTPR